MAYILIPSYVKELETMWSDRKPRTAGVTKDHNVLGLDITWYQDMCSLLLGGS